MTEMAWAQARLAGLPLTFQQRAHWSHPALQIYEVPVAAAGAVPADITVHIAPSEWSPQQVMQDVPKTTGPVITSGPLTFLGYTLRNDEADIVLETFWRVTGGADRPLSLMAHLLSADGNLVSVADGLGVPIEYWRAGDIIVQRHSFAGSVTGPAPAYIQTGVYWLDTMERWQLGG